MGLRGLLFQRSWSPPRLYRSPEEESAARDRARIRRHERLYNWTRYLVAVAVVLVLTAVVATIVSFYVNRVGNQSIVHFEPFANIQAHALQNNESVFSEGSESDPSDEVKSRPMRWDPMGAGRSYSNRGPARNNPVRGRQSSSAKDRPEVSGRSGNHDPKSYGSSPQVQPRGNHDSRGGYSLPAQNGREVYSGRGHENFMHAGQSYGVPGGYPTTLAVPVVQQQAYGFTPAPAPGVPQGYVYTGPIVQQQNFGYPPAPAVQVQPYGYTPAPYPPPQQSFSYAPLAPQQGFGYPPAPAAQFPVPSGQIPPWQAYQDSLILSTPAPPSPPTNGAPPMMFYTKPTAAPTSQPQSGHQHDHDHVDHHSLLFGGSHGGTYVAQIIPTEKEEDLTHRHSDDDHEHGPQEHNPVECGFKCTKDSACIPENQRCDGRVQCADASDEHDCDCLARIGAKKLCDGIMDCPYGEDEDQCYGCTKDQFSCKDPYDNDVKTQQRCIEKDKRCDGVPDCPNARDETHCFRLGAVKNEERGLLSEGLLQKMIKGTWYFICKRSESEDVVRAVATTTCKMLVGDLGDEDPETSSVPGTSTEYSSLNYAFIGDNDADFEIAGMQCPGKRLIRVQCPDPMCGYPVSRYEAHTYGGIKQVGGGYDLGERYKRNRYSLDDQIMGKVVGGYDSRLGDWPFLVGIYRNGQFHCGGSLIHRQWVLTAAHCTHSFEKYVFEAQVGQIRRYSWSPYEQTRMITEVHVHERYDNHVFMNDIALMKLDRPVYLSKWVTTACLSHEKSMDPETDEMCQVVGWGDLSEDGSPPDHVQEVALPVKPCKETFTRESIQLCAGYEEGGKDACQGDSGGPFICRDYDDRLIVAGLVSFGRGCARAGQLGVYTRISAYRKWIDSIVSGQSETYDEGNYYPKVCEGSTCYRSGGACLFDKMRCDQTIDCLYGDDEVDCTYNNLNYVPETYHVDSKAIEEVREASHGHEEHTHGGGGAKLCHETQEFQCRVSKGCVPLSKRCNGEFDCSDYTDEKDCDCPTILENSHPNKTCDGLADCEDDADETDCDYCEGDEQKFPCVLSPGKCVPKNRWCDGTVHCPYGEDEVDCFRIVRDKFEVPTEVFLSSKKSRSLTSGYLFYRRGGTEWQRACSADFGQNLEEVVCPYLSFSTPGSTTSKNYKRNAPRYVERKLPVGEAIRGRSSEKETECDQAVISCGEASCGERRLYSFAAGKSPPPCGLTGTHPWLGTVLVNGEIRCMATIVSRQWAAASSQCIRSYMKLLTKDYVAVRVGQIDMSMKVSTPMEQVKRVNYIQQEDGLALLHLDKSVQMDQFSTPICTNFGNPIEFQDELLNYCVQITLESNTFKFKHVTVKTAGDIGGQQHFAVHFNSAGCNIPPEGAFIYCSTDPDTITSWYFVGFLDSSYCAAKQTQIELENPFFGTDASKYQDLIGTLPPSTVAPPSCTGFRCSHGNCIPKTDICDKISHCMDGLDEKHCKASYQIYRAFGDDEYTVSNVTGSSCPEGHFRCSSTYNCVPISTFCDGNYDCGSDDPTDEPEGQCTCRKYLEMVAPEKICDPAGRIDCPDRSDESGCPCQRRSFICDETYNALNSSSGCIHHNLRCDGVQDCKNGKDEENCIALSIKVDQFIENKTDTSYSGYVVLLVRNQWHPYCSHEWSTRLGTAVCKELGYTKMDNIDVRDLEQIRYPRRKRYGGYSTAAETSSQQNLVIWRKEDDILGENSYGIEDQESYEDCNVAHISCSN